MKKVEYIDLYGKTGEVSIDKLKFRPSVYGVMFENQKILLIKQFGTYTFPGGGIEIDEVVEEALKREMFEETGLSVESRGIIDCRSNFFFANMESNYYNSILLYYLCEKISGDLSGDNFDKYEKEYSEVAEWVDLKDIKNKKFHNDEDRVIEKALKILKSSQ